MKRYFKQTKKNIKIKISKKKKQKRKKKDKNICLINARDTPKVMPLIYFHENFNRRMGDLITSMD